MIRFVWPRFFCLVWTTWFEYAGKPLIDKDWLSVSGSQIISSPMTLMLPGIIIGYKINVTINVFPSTHNILVVVCSQLLSNSFISASLQQSLNVKVGIVKVTAIKACMGPTPNICNRRGIRIVFLRHDCWVLVWLWSH